MTLWSISVHYLGSHNAGIVRNRNW